MKEGNRKVNDSFGAVNESSALIDESSINIKEALGIPNIGQVASSYQDPAKKPSKTAQRSKNIGHYIIGKEAGGLILPQARRLVKELSAK